MKRLSIIGFIIILLTTAGYAEKTCRLIPYPKEVKNVHSTFEFSNQITLIYDKEFAGIAYYFQKELLRYRRISIPLQLNFNNAKKTQSILLCQIPKNKTNQENDESFSLKMNKQRILIEAQHQKGAFNAMVSLLQLILLSDVENSKITLDCWDIKDNPQYEWRGIMLDESRHFFGKERVKRLLDWMAIYKLNKFHWHLTDAPGWRIEIKKYPKLTYVGGIGNHSNPFTPAMYYTQEDIKEIVSYASERFIDIIPEIDMPGHASAANRAYPDFSGGGSKRFPEFTFNPGKESVYAYLTDILREVDALFPSQIIHIGGDEVHFGNENWKTDKDVKNLMEREEIKDLKGVEDYFIKRMADSLIAINNKVAAWDEVVESALPIEKTIVFYWRKRFPEQLQKAINNGFPIVLCPNQPLYFDYRQDSSLQVGHNPHLINSLSDVYKFDHNKLPVNFNNKTNILGIQGNIWSERISTNERLDFMTFPRITALAESAWNGNQNKDYELFLKRLEKHLLLYNTENIYYFNPFNIKSNKEPAK